MSQASEKQAEAHEKAMQADEYEANGLVGGYIAHYRVLRREKPGKRVLYVLIDGRTGQEKRLQGYELVRLIRECVNNGLPVIRLTQPWRNEKKEEGK